MPVGNARILIVDGRRDSSDDLARELAAQGYRVRQAADASAAVDALHRERADLVLIEANLPGWIDGAALAGFIAGREVPVVMMAGTPEAESRLEHLPYPCLCKPLAADETGRVVREALSAAYGTA